jgi:hypothetical protein
VPFGTVVAKLDDLPKGAEVIVFTDLQKSSIAPGGEEGGKAFDGLVAAVRGKDATLALVRAGKGVADNLAVTSVTMASKLAQVGRPTRFSVAIRNFGSRTAGGVVNFSVDGADAGGDATTIDAIEPGKESVVDFRHTFAETGPHLVEARFVTDALETDNRRALSVVVQDRVETRIVDGNPGTDRRRRLRLLPRGGARPDGGDDRRGAFGVVVDDETGFERADLAKTVARRVGRRGSAVSATRRRPRSVRRARRRLARLRGRPIHGSAGRSGPRPRRQGASPGAPRRADRHRRFDRRGLRVRRW